MNNENRERLIEFHSFSNIFVALNKLGLILLALFIPFLLIVKQFFNFPIPNGFFLNLFAFGLVMIFYLYLLTKKVTNDAQFRKLCFSYYILVIILVTIVIHYLGSVEGHAWFLYSFLVIVANITLSKKEGALITLWTIICCAALLLLEYFGIIPHHTTFIKVTGGYNDLFSLLVDFFGVICLGFGFIAFISHLFSGVYRRVSEQLTKTTGELEEAKATLEVKVQARVKELEELTKDLDRQVKDRTKELQEKVEELEKFQKLAVGREMKMIELKEKIKKMEEKK